MLGRIDDMAGPNRPHGMEQFGGASSQVTDGSMHRKVNSVNIGKRHARQAERTDNARHILDRHVCTSFWALVTPPVPSFRSRWSLYGPHANFSFLTRGCVI